MADVRKPPIGAVLRLHPQGRRGTCGWCGLPCLDKTEVRGWLKYYHNACSVEMAIIGQPDMARHYVKERDHGICEDCGAPPTMLEQRHLKGKGTRWEQWEEVLVSSWHVDHKIPLWKVRHMPDLQRLEYFKLANLITRCHKCHERKTSEEAAERAKFRRQGAAPAIEKPKRGWAKGRKIPPRPFPKRIK